MASAAFPIGFTPIVLRNYPKALCSYTAPQWVRLAAYDAQVNPRRFERARNYLSYEDEHRRPFVYLIDGTYADPKALREPEVAVTTQDSPWSVLRLVNRGAVKRIVIIATDSTPDWADMRTRLAGTPDMVMTLSAAARAANTNYASDTLEMLRLRFSSWSDQAVAVELRRTQVSRSCAQLAGDLCRHANEACKEQRFRLCYERLAPSTAQAPPIPNVYFINLRTDTIADAALRLRVAAIPESFNLSREDSDLLIDVGRQLLRTSPEYLRLMQDLEAPEEPR